MKLIHQISRLFLLLGILLCGSFNANAFPPCKEMQNPLCIFKLLEKDELVGAIRLRNVSPARGHYLSVFYVTGKRPSIALDDRELNVTKVKYVVPSILVTGEAITLPAVSLQTAKKGAPSYDYVVFVYHDQIQYFWTNMNGSYPEDPRLETGASYQRSNPCSVKVYSRKQLSDLDTAQNHPSELTLDI